MALSIGDKAPDFTLFDSDKQPCTLSDLQGKKNVLLLFFPMAFTGTCTKELCSVRDDIGKYDNASTEVFGISVDSVFTLEKYKSEQAFNYRLLSDFNKSASEGYDTIYSSFTDMAMKGVSKRSAFIIDKDGVIQYAEVLENAGEIPDFSAIDKKLEELA
jgi:peroxiredoxin